MTDIKNARWALSSSEKYAVRWLEQRGYDVILKKQYLSKTIFTVSKDCIGSTLELPQGIKTLHVKAFMEQFEQARELELEIRGFQSDAFK